MSELLEILDRFLKKDDWSVSSAGELEGQLDDFVDEEGVSDLQDILASYRPGGGELLYDKDTLEKEIKYLIRLKQSKN